MCRADRVLPVHARVEPLKTAQDCADVLTDLLSSVADRVEPCDAGACALVSPSPSPPSIAAAWGRSSVTATSLRSMPGGRIGAVDGEGVDRAGTSPRRPCRPGARCRGEPGTPFLRCLRSSARRSRSSRGRRSFTSRCRRPVAHPEQRVEGRAATASPSSTILVTGRAIMALVIATNSTDQSRPLRDHRRMRISILLGDDRNLSRLSSWICSGDARRDIRQKQRARSSVVSSPGERAMDVVASNVVAATVMAGWAAVIYVVGVESSGTCPPPSAASVESLFAPCLVRVRQPPRLDPSFAPYDAPLSIPAPTPKAPGMTDEPAVAARPSVDAEATGSVASGRDRLQRDQ